MFFHIGGKGSEPLLPHSMMDCLLATNSRTLVNIEKNSFNYCILYPPSNGCTMLSNWVKKVNPPSPISVSSSTAASPHS